MKSYEDCVYRDHRCPTDLSACPCVKYRAYADAKDPTVVKRVLTKLEVDPGLTGWRLIYAMQTKFMNRFHVFDPKTVTRAEVDHWAFIHLTCVEDELREVRECLWFFNEDEASASPEVTRKEVVDALHFVMDVCISCGFTADELNDALGLPENALVDALYREGFRLDDRDRDLVRLLRVDDVAQACGVVRQALNWKYWKRPDDSPDFKARLLAPCLNLLKKFFALCTVTFESGDQVVREYVRKNVENVLRQEYGY